MWPGRQFAEPGPRQTARMTAALNLQDALSAFRAAFTYDHPEGLTIDSRVAGRTLRELYLR